MFRKTLQRFELDSVRAAIRTANNLRRLNHRTVRQIVSLDKLRTIIIPELNDGIRLLTHIHELLMLCE